MVLMPREVLDRIIEDIRNDVLKLSEVTKKAVFFSIEALREKNVEKADIVYKLEEESDLLNLDIENKILSTVARYHPVAGDLRFFHAMMKVSSNYERICDLAQKIAEFVKKSAEKPLIKPLIDIPKMRDIIIDMIEQNEYAIKNHTTEPTNFLQNMDDKIDMLYEQIFNELVGIMVKDPKTVPDAIDLLFVARYLERIGDIVAKSGARIVYMIEGRRVWIK